MLRALTPAILQQEVAFLPSRPQQQRLNVFGGWAEGDASYTGENASNDVTIKQRKAMRRVLVFMPTR